MAGIPCPAWGDVELRLHHPVGRRGSESLSLRPAINHRAIFAKPIRAGTEECYFHMDVVLCQARLVLSIDATGMTISARAFRPIGLRKCSPVRSRPGEAADIPCLSFGYSARCPERFARLRIYFPSSRWIGKMRNLISHARRIGELRNLCSPARRIGKIRNRCHSARR